MKENLKTIAQNKKAFHDYFLEESFEAGIELCGTEVKSIRQGRVNLKDSWCSIVDGEMLVNGMHISPYEQGNIFNKDPMRVRRLLMHKREIMRLFGLVKQDGYSLIPVSLYFKGSRVKVQVGLCKGKKLYDKRADIAKLNRIQLHLDDLVTQMGQQLYDGQIAAEPLVAGAGRNPCVWCDYSFICCHETGIGERALEAPAKPFEPEEADDGKEGEQA